MKFYDCRTAPSPRRVRIFMAEKGIELSTVQVDLRHGEQLGDPFKQVNPWCTVPVLELDDGTTISEVVAVCRYLEEAYPDPPLMGVDTKDRAVVVMWDHRFENDGFLAVGEVLRNSAPGLKDRALTGAASVEQIAALVERGRARVRRFLAALDEQLGANEFVTGARYTIADITAQVATDFAVRLDLPIPPDHVHARRWHDAVSQRPSAAA